MPLNNPPLVSESGLVLSDLTTANASTSAHGFQKKLSGSPLDFVRGDGSQLPWLNYPVWACDFLGNTGNVHAPWSSVIVGTGGQIFYGTGLASNPGIAKMYCGTVSGGGWLISTQNTAFLLSGGETTNIIFELDVTTGTTVYAGFHNATALTVPTYGVYLDITGTAAYGRAHNNCTSPPTLETSTGSAATLTTGVYYRLNITLNLACTLATFTIYTCSTGAVLWTDTVASNFPAAACGHGILLSSTASSSVSTVKLDYMDICINRALVR